MLYTLWCAQTKATGFYCLNMANCMIRVLWRGVRGTAVGASWRPVLCGRQCAAATARPPVSQGRGFLLVAAGAEEPI
jgi:hypothetical protein